MAAPQKLGYEKKPAKPRRTWEDYFWIAAAFAFMAMCVLIGYMLATGRVSRL